jgi:large repetitive protein
VTFTATASDQHGIGAVEFLAGGVVVGTATTAPYTLTWDSTTSPDGTVALIAHATDTFGTKGTTDALSVTVDNTPPAVGLTSPLSGTRAEAGTYVTLSASASDASGVTRVEFYVDGALYTSRTTAPYSASWYTGRALGSHVFTVRATDLAGNTALSDPVAIEVVDSALPTVWLDSPSSGSRLHGTVTVSANPYDSFGIAKVEFYAGATSIGTVTASPWSIAWNTAGSADGTVAVTARAYDPSGNVGASSAVSVTVDNTPPAVGLTSPLSGTRAEAGTYVTLSASASDAIEMSKVEFLVDGAVVGTSYYAPYAISWYSRGTPLGQHTVVARAADLAGNLTSSTAAAIQLVDVTAPSVYLTAPSYGASIRGTAVTLAATASDDYGVAKVEFYRGGLLAGTATSAPWQVTWSTAGSLDGTYSFTAEAYDGSGNVATSSSVSARVDNTPPTVSLTAPAANVTVPGPITVSAIASDANGVQKVEFYAGTLLVKTLTSAPYSFLWDPAGIATGTYVLTAKAYDLAGGTTTSAGVTVKVGPDTTPPSVYIDRPNRYWARGDRLPDRDRERRRGGHPGEVHPGRQCPHRLGQGFAVHHLLGQLDGQ